MTIVIMILLLVSVIAPPGAKESQLNNCAAKIKFFSVPSVYFCYSEGEDLHDPFFNLQKVLILTQTLCFTNSPSWVCDKNPNQTLIMKLDHYIFFLTGNVILLLIRSDDTETNVLFLGCG